MKMDTADVAVEQAVEGPCYSALAPGAELQLNTCIGRKIVFVMLGIDEVSCSKC